MERPPAPLDLRDLDIMTVRAVDRGSILLAGRPKQESIYATRRQAGEARDMTPDIKVQVHNYKSLRHVDVGGKPFQVLVGPNASGKSNIADALDFLSDVYNLGLETAIARKGGYENICFRRKRRSKAGVQFDVSARVDAGLGPESGYFNIKHIFQVTAKGEAIQADFAVTQEDLVIDYVVPARSSRQLPLSVDGHAGSPNLVHFSRELGQAEGKLDISELPTGLRQIDQWLERLRKWATPGTDVGDTELAMAWLSRAFWPLGRFRTLMGRIRVFQISPQLCREPGVLTPNPELARDGRNLPAVVSFLESRHKEAYGEIMGRLREIVPSLEELQVRYTHRRTLTLDFKETAVGRPWAIEEMSDGTVQALSILVAIHDPRSSFVVIEEPENSIHPWILRGLIGACRDMAKLKQFLITTHSPVVINMLQPGDLWIVSKMEGETHITRAETLDDSLKAIWERGDMSLYEFLDTGILREAVPAVSSARTDA